jgi:hypothetical protein
MSTTNLAEHTREGMRNVARCTVPAVRTIARLGYTARGCVYCLIGLLAGMAAVGAAGGEVTDTRGVLETIVIHPFGRALLAVISIGFFAFALWLFVLAIEDPDDRGRNWRGLIARSGSFIGGLGYLSLLITSIHIIVGNHVSSGEHAARNWSAWAMAWPLGRLALAVVGVIIIIVGFVNMWSAIRRDIGRLLDRQRLAGRARTAAVMVGRVGIAARGVVFCLIGSFLALAAWHSDPREARGLAGALHYVERQPYGPWLLALVAAGFVAYGAFELIEARYRRVEPSLS